MDTVESPRELNSLTRKLIGAAVEVNKHLGPGLLERVYHQAMCLELAAQGIPFESHVPIPVDYKGEDLGFAYEADIVAYGLIVLELKSVDDFSMVHSAQCLNYMALLQKPLGLLLNFNKRYIAREGLKTTRHVGAPPTG